jgi:hypothetical protein
MTITEFLEARIVEDEARALTANAWASHGGPTQWIGQPGDGLVVRLGDGGPHIAAWSPTRVLAECAAKRAIITQVSDVQWGGYAVRDVILGHLAAVYADHPDYDPDWAR